METQDLGETNARSILIVDDEPDTCRLLEMLFSSHGYCAKAVYSGQEAVHWVETNEPDVLILDIMMPELDGWETFSQVRLHSNAPVIFLTALSDGDCAARALSLGRSDYLRKPYNAQELLARVEALLASAPARSAARFQPGSHQVNAGPAVTVIIPAFNEARFIGSTVLKAREYTESVIVVDDGSTDNTAEIAAAAGAIVVRHACNQGKGAALNTGFRKARELGAQVVAMLDGDGQHCPEELAQVVAPVLAGEADIVIGSRYLAGGCNVPRHRVWGHRAFNLLANSLSGERVTDSQSGFRAFSQRAVEAIAFLSKGFSVESEMQFLAHENDLKVLEVPVNIRYLDRPKRPILSHGLAVLNGMLNLTGQYRPLLFFGLPGTALLLTGIVWGLWVVEIFRRTRDLAMGYALISVLLSIVGLIMLSTGFTLHSLRGLLLDLFQSKKTNL